MLLKINNLNSIYLWIIFKPRILLEKRKKRKEKGQPQNSEGGILRKYEHYSGSLFFLTYPPVLSCPSLFALSLSLKNSRTTSLLPISHTPPPPPHTHTNKQTPVTRTQKYNHKHKSPFLIQAYIPNSLFSFPFSFFFTEKSLSYSFRPLGLGFSHSAHLHL